MSERCQTVTEVVYYNNLIHNIFCKYQKGVKQLTGYIMYQNRLV